MALAMELLLSSMAMPTRRPELQHLSTRDHVLLSQLNLENGC
jgi:hypothetical protein